MSAEASLRVDGRITVALVIAVAIQTAAALLWTGAAAERLANVESKINAQGPVTERLARLEEQLTDVRRTLQRIETNIDEKGHSPNGL